MIHERAIKRHFFGLGEDEPFEKPTLFDVQPNLKREDFDTLVDAFHYFMDQIYDGTSIGSWGIARLTGERYQPMRDTDAYDREDFVSFITFDFWHDYSTRFFDEQGNQFFTLPEGK